MRRRLILSIGILIVAVFVSFFVAVRSVAGEESADLMNMPEECSQRAYEMLLEEIALYREVQYGSDTKSVLMTVGGNTSDLVPYLVENYHALSCRLYMVCDAVRVSQGHLNEEGLLSYRPLGCSRMLGARGRWWSEDRRDQTFRVGETPISECAYSEMETIGNSTIPSFYLTESTCREWVDQILAEERQTLKLLVARDSAERTMRRAVPLFQSVLSDVRERFLLPLRGFVDLVGIVLHPIPCLLKQCN